MGEIRKAKVCIIGDAGVGKTSILLRLTENRFSDKSEVTIGTDVKNYTMEVNGRQIELEIWDTVGQERYRSLTSSFYRGCHGVILVFDVTHKPSLAGLSQWMCEIESYKIKKTNCILVGNKSDLTKEVDDSDVASVANHYSLQVIETSAKDGTDVKKAFNEIAKLIVDHSSEDQPSKAPGKTKPSGSIKVGKVTNTTNSGKGGCAC